MTIIEKLKEIKNPVKFTQRVYRALTYRLVRLFDARRDRRICGMSLSRIYATNILGGAGYSGTCYWTLEEIFGQTKFEKNDSIIDIGCGQGRLFAFLIEMDFPGRMTGVEYHAETAAFAQVWTQKYPEKKIHIITGDAFAQQYDEYNIFYYFNSFKKEYFIKFIELLESQLTHHIRFYFMTDQLCWKFLWQRPGWEMVYRKKSYRKYGLCMWGSPQRWSIWTYTPSHRRE